MELQGSLTVSFTSSNGLAAEVTFPTSDFLLEEDGVRNLGGGDMQYECLMIAHDNDYRFSIGVQATSLQGVITLYQPIFFDVEPGVQCSVVEDELGISTGS